jgi:protein phosphatase
MYLVRHGHIRQLTKDHTVVGEQVRMGLMSSSKAREHPQRSTLSRSLGRELIVSIDRITMPLEANDRLIVCSDGLYNVLSDKELEHLSRELDAAQACRRLIDAAISKGAPDNVTAAVFFMNGSAPGAAAEPGFHQRIARMLRPLWSRSRRGRDSIRHQRASIGENCSIATPEYEC